MASHRAWAPARAASSLGPVTIRRPNHSGPPDSSTDSDPSQSAQGTVMSSQSVEPSGGVEPSR